MKRTIEFYNREVYGTTREYVANENDANIIFQLTGKKTVTSVEFKQILPPSKSK